MGKGLIGNKGNAFGKSIITKTVDIHLFRHMTKAISNFAFAKKDCSFEHLSKFSELWFSNY